jgi:SdpC family antimicrobial peptide
MLRTLDGEQLYRGLFFGEEPVARFFPEMWGGSSQKDEKWTPEHQVAFSTWKREVIAHIQQADPTFFTRFRTEVTSGQHRRIARIMDESETLLTASGAPSPSQSGTFTHVYTDRTFVDLYIWHNQGGGSPVGAAGLQRDEIVQRIASRLRVR